MIKMIKSIEIRLSLNRWLFQEPVSPSPPETSPMSTDSPPKKLTIIKNNGKYKLKTSKGRNPLKLSLKEKMLPQNKLAVLKMKKQLKKRRLQKEKKDRVKRAYWKLKAIEPAAESDELKVSTFFLGLFIFQVLFLRQNSSSCVKNIDFYPILFLEKNLMGWQPKCQENWWKCQDQIFKSPLFLFLNRFAVQTTNIAQELFLVVFLAVWCIFKCQEILSNCAREINLINFVATLQNFFFLKKKTVWADN